MKCHIRIDDFPYGTPEDKEKYDRDIEFEKIEALDESGIKYMLGVVPEELRYLDLAFLKTLKNCTVCMHGFNHALDKWRPSDEEGGEFANMSIKDIRHRFHQNEEFMGEFDVDIFIPPFNSFNQQLLDILNEYAFKVITGGRETIRDGKDKLRFGNLKLELPTLCDNINRLYTKLPGININQSITFHLAWQTIEDILRFIRISKEINLEYEPYGST